jgi:hypothetical protein
MWYFAASVCSHMAKEVAPILGDSSGSRLYRSFGFLPHEGKLWVEMVQRSNTRETWAAKTDGNSLIKVVSSFAAF